MYEQLHWAKACGSVCRRCGARVSWGPWSPSCYAFQGILLGFSQQPRTGLCPILSLRKWGHRDTKQFVQSHTGTEWISPQVSRQPLPPGPTPPTLLSPESSSLPEKQACFFLILTDHKDSALSSEIFGKFYLNVLCSLLTNTKKRKKNCSSKQECPFREEWACVLRAEKCLPVQAVLPSPGSPGVGWPVPVHFLGAPSGPGTREQTPVLRRRTGSPRQVGK